MTEQCTWSCHVCGRDRPDEKISVAVKEVSKMFGFPEGTIKQNIRFCNDVPRCKEIAESARSFRDLWEVIQEEAK